MYKLAAGCCHVTEVYSGTPCPGPPVMVHKPLSMPRQCLPAQTYTNTHSIHVSVLADPQWSVRPAASRFLLETGMPGNYEK